MSGGASGGIQGLCGQSSVFGKRVTLAAWIAGQERNLPGCRQKGGGGARQRAPAQYLRGQVYEAATI